MELTLPILANYLEEFLHASSIVDFCHNGIQVSGKHVIQTMGTAVSCTLETIERAIELKCDALIVHHGLFWNRDSHVISGVKREKIKALLENNISLLAYHLPLDMHAGVGNNWKAAQDLGFEQIEAFGVGVKGVFPEIDIEAFQRKIESYYEHVAHSALGGKKRVKSAAIISGGAHKEIFAAASAGVDCFITGSFDEPTWPAAHEEGINFFALGHSATERIGPKTLAYHLAKTLEVPAHFIDIPNPF